MIHLKLCRNCAFPQNFHAMELGEISVFCSVKFAVGSSDEFIHTCWRENDQICYVLSISNVFYIFRNAVIVVVYFTFSSM